MAEELNGTKLPAPLPPEEVTIHSQALAAVINAKCMGELVKGSGVIRFVSDDGKFRLDLPVEFGGFVPPDGGCIFSITILRNTAERPAVQPMGGKLLKPDGRPQ